MRATIVTLITRSNPLPRLVMIRTFSQATAECGLAEESPAGDMNDCYADVRRHVVDHQSMHCLSRQLG